MKINLNTSFITILFVLMFGFANAKQFEATWESIDSRPVPEWWQEAKFGIFIHWGIYSVPAFAQDYGPIGLRYTEWYKKRLIRGTETFVAHHNKYHAGKSYEDFVTDFRAEHFDPDSWAELFKRAGARYVVLTSKHHDGFALWPSPANYRWNSTVIGPNRDLVGDLTESVRNKGLEMGLYYSLLEWNNPLYNTENIDKFVERINLPEMKYLVERYQPSVLWTDGEWDFTVEQLRSKEFLQWLYNESSVRETIVVNDRWGRGVGGDIRFSTRGQHGGHFTTEYGSTYSQRDEDEIFMHPWEECRGIGFSFGYNRFETIEDYLTNRECIELLIDTASRGGNLLLNVGPKANGLIPVVMEERLLAMGKWLEVNGESIYGTRAGYVQNQEKLREQGIYFTRKENVLYAFDTNPTLNDFAIEGLSSVESVTILGSDLEVEFRSESAGIVVSPPDLRRLVRPSKYALVYRMKLN